MTAAMKRARDAIVEFIARHGTAPSIGALASELQCNKTNAARLLNCLHERGEVTKSKYALAMGSGGVAIVVPAHLAAKLASFCATGNERLSDVAADAIALHLDALAEGCDR